jgi:PEP-CTERM motif
MRTVNTLLLAFFGLLAMQGRAVASTISVCDANPLNLVTNCGFETGDFTSWTLSGNDVPFELGNLYGVEGVDPFDGMSPNSGLNQAYFADLVSNATTLSQTLATQIGDTYQISWFLAQDTDPASPYSNAFSASFGGNPLTSLTSLPVQGYTRYSYTMAATSASTTLSFTLGNDLGEFLLDDISVATPEPATWLCALIGAALCGLAVRRRILSRS